MNQYEGEQGLKSVGLASMRSTALVKCLCWLGWRTISLGQGSAQVTSRGIKRSYLTLCDVSDRTFLISRWLIQSLCVASKHNTLTQCWGDVGHRLRRWPNITPTLGQRLLFAGICTALWCLQIQSPCLLTVRMTWLWFIHIYSHLHDAIKVTAGQK